LEGAAVAYRYFEAIKLCDASSKLTEETWRPVVEAVAARRTTV
jgi:hypothetical protein